MFTTNLIFQHGKIRLYENVTKPQWSEKTAVLTQNDLVIFSSKFTEEKEEGKIQMLNMRCAISLEEGSWQVNLVKNSKKNSFRVDSETTAKKWQKKIVLAASWTNYEHFCEFQQLKPWIYLLRWATRADYPLTINLKHCNSFAISEFMRNNSFVNALILEKIQNDISGLSRVLNGIKPYQLQVLIISHGNIDDVSLNFAKKPISSNHALVKLDLSWNFLTQNSIPVLFKILAKTPLVEVLAMSGNKIADQGFQILFPEVLSQIPVKELMVNECELTDDSLACVRKAFKIKNAMLRKIDLSKNLFTTAGTVQILKKSNKYNKKKLLQLVFSLIPIEKDIVKYLSGTNCVIKRSTSKKSVPKVLWHKEAIENMSKKIDSLSESPYIEDLVQIINELAQLDFQFPKARVERLEKIAFEYLSHAVSQPNYYCLELLVPVMLKIGIRHIQAEDMLNLLKPEVDHIVNTLINVLSPELYTEENIPEINSLLDSVVKRCDELCIRGQIVQLAKMLKNKRDELVKRNKLIIK